MKGGKDEEMAMSPMFPRLHVNDTEKAGPRAPPRNKMALYEQLTIPSQRFNSGSTAMSSSLPLSNGSHLVPSPSSAHDCGQERSLFTPICNSPVPTRFPKKLHSYSINAVEFNISMEILEQNSIKPTNIPSLNGTDHISSSAKYHPPQKQNFSNFKNSLVKKVRGADDFTVPTSAQSDTTPHCRAIQQNIDTGKAPNLSSKSSGQLQIALKKERKGAGTMELKSRQHVTNLVGRDQKMSYLSDKQSEEHTKRLATIFSTRDKILADTCSSPLKDKISLKRIHTSSNRENRSSLVEDRSKSHGVNPSLRQECVDPRENIASRYSVWVEPAKVLGRTNASKVRVKTCPKPSLGHDHRSSCGFGNGTKYCEDKDCESLQGGDVNHNEDVSDISMVDCLSCLNLSPDDVVGIIGEDQFWKARKVIVSQQRVFAVQVFELHRLIKVQQLIAGSPHILLGDDLSLGKPLLSISPAKKVSSEYVLEPPPLIVKPKDHPQKPNSTTEYASENVIGKLPLPSINKDARKGLVTSGSNYGPSPANMPPTSPWCFHPPPGNQWLIPIMSPSQGLVYKPYSGPCPQAAGFMAPIYGSCGPMDQTSGNGDCLSTAYAVTASYQQGIGHLQGTPPFSQTYFPPYGTPIMDPSKSSSAFEQMSPFIGAQLNELDNQFSTRDTNFNMPYQSSCNRSSQKSVVNGTYQSSKYSDLWGSTASSQSEREQGDAIPLFPMEPMVKIPKEPVETHSTKQQTRVIKVAPHNPRLATESAARIFQSIQEEREQCV